MIWKDIVILIWTRNSLEEYNFVKLLSKENLTNKYAGK